MSNINKIDISAGTIFRIILTLIGFWLLYVVFDVILMLFAAVIIASAIEPAANYAQKFKIPRALTVAVIYLLILLMLSGLITLMIDPLATQATQLAHAAPQLVNLVSDFIPQLTTASVATTVQDTLVNFGDNLTNISLNIFQRTRSFFSGVFTIIFIFILAFYLAVEKDAIKKFFRLITPKQHLPYIERAVDRAQKSISRWVLAQLLLAVIMGLIVGLGLWIMGVPYALLLGLIAGIMEFIPVIGPIIAAVPAVFVGLSQSLVLGLVVLGFYIVLQQIENNLLVPNLMRRAVGLNPIVTIIAVLLGARLLGLVGVILAVPLAAIISIILSDIFRTGSSKKTTA